MTNNWKSLTKHCRRTFIDQKMTGVNDFNTGVFLKGNQGQI